MKIHSLVLCRKHVVSKNGSSNLVGILRDIPVAAVPIIYDSAVLYGWGVAASGQYVAHLSCYAPDGSAVGTQEIPMALDNDGVYEVVVQLERLPLAMQGEYRFELSCQGSAHTLSFFVYEKAVKDSYTSNEVAAILSNPELLSTVSIAGTCPKCGTKHSFVKSIDPEYAPSSDDIPFPDSLAHICSHCKQYTFSLRPALRMAWSRIGTPKGNQSTSRPRKDVTHEKASIPSHSAAKEIAAGDERKNG